jgi:hypothetical protein
VVLSWVATGVFTVAAVVATIAPGTAGVVAVLDVALFAVGIGAFFRAYATAVARSRTDAIGIGGLFFLAGSAPGPVRVRLLGALGVQIVVALVTASIRLYTPVAFGVLVPVLGLGLAGLWGARHGLFPPRSEASEA